MIDPLSIGTDGNDNVALQRSRICRYIRQWGTYGSQHQCTHDGGKDQDARIGELFEIPDLWEAHPH